MGIDAAEVVLIFVLIVLTVLLIVLGIQVFLILKEFRKTVTKANKVLDDTGTITQSVSGPLSNLSSIGTSFKFGSVLTVVKIIRGLLDKEKTTRSVSSGQGKEKE